MSSADFPEDDDETCNYILQYLHSCIFFRDIGEIP